MNSAIEHLIKGSRRQIRDWRRSISLFSAGAMHLYSNGTDISAKHILDLESYISEHEALIEKYDPDGLTADDNVEFGDVGGLAMELYPNRALAFTVDGNGEADALHVFDSDEEARAFTQGKVGYHVGHVSQDGWSIISIEP